MSNTKPFTANFSIDFGQQIGVVNVTNWPNVSYGALGIMRMGTTFINYTSGLNLLDINTQPFTNVGAEILFNPTCNESITYHEDEPHLRGGCVIG
jgi:hypothetical protein